MGAPSGGWCTGVVREVRHPLPGAVLLRIEVPHRVDHLPGQHYVFRLTAEDGYTASRSYSVASPPRDPLLEFFVERLDDGEVSTHLADVVEVGDELELRGPVGGWFVWEGERPMVGIAGGSGVVPLVAMLRHARDVGRVDRVRLVVSARTVAETPYADELAGQRLLTTREAYGGRPARRLGADDLVSFAGVGPATDFFVCGSSGFAESATRLLLQVGVDPTVVRVERFGPTA